MRQCDTEYPGRWEQAERATVGAGARVVAAQVVSIAVLRCDALHQEDIAAEGMSGDDQVADPWGPVTEKPDHIARLKDGGHGVPRHQDGLVIRLLVGQTGDQLAVYQVTSRFLVAQKISWISFTASISS